MNASEAHTLATSRRFGLREIRAIPNLLGGSDALFQEVVVARSSKASMSAPLTLQPSTVTGELIAFAVQTAEARGVTLVLVLPPAPVERELLDGPALESSYGLTMRYLVEHGCPIIVLGKNRYAVQPADLRAFLLARRADPAQVVLPSVEVS